jgi:hypothetical protein
MIGKWSNDCATGQPINHLTINTVCNLPCMLTHSTHGAFPSNRETRARSWAPRVLAIPRRLPMLLYAASPLRRAKTTHAANLSGTLCDCLATMSAVEIRPASTPGAATH